MAASALHDLDEKARFPASDDERTAALVVQRVFEAVAKLPGESRNGTAREWARRLLVKKSNAAL